MRDLLGVLTIGFVIAEFTVLLPLLAMWLAGE